ncbi:hypothetical protein ACA910_008715 [Epithemia clementina (nom. ined.)]
MAGDSDRECCKNCCPYGVTFMAPCILSIMAIAFTWSATFGCNYLEVTVDLLYADYSFGVGPWTLEKSTIASIDDAYLTIEKECVGWNEENDGYLGDRWIDAPMKTARAFSLMGALLGFIFWVPLMFGACITLQPAMLKLMVLVFGAVGVFMILTLSMLASDVCTDLDDCKLYGGGAAAIIAFVCWIATSLTIMCMKEKASANDNAPLGPAPQEEQPLPETTVAEQITENEDGSVIKVTTTTTTDGKGNKTIKETREEVKQTAVATEVDIPVAKEE